MSVLQNNQITDLQRDEELLSQKVDELRQEIKDSELPSILCRTKKNNPNYFSVLFSNDKMQQEFNLNELDIVGKNYDFLFQDIDLDYVSEYQIEYVRLIKSVKNFEASSVILPIEVVGNSLMKYKVSFIPVEMGNIEYHYAKITFQKAEINSSNFSESQEKRESNLVLLKNLERTLRKERLLREVASLIISDLSISEIAHKISEILCEYLKADRCIMHDYQDSQTTFIAEYCNKYSKRFFIDKNDSDGLSKIAKYINFHNRFFEKFGDKKQRNFLTIIENVSSDQNFASILPLCQNMSIGSIVAVTTTFNEKINGGIYIHQSNIRSWIEDEVELVQMIADQFSIAVDRSQSIEKVMVTNHALMERTIELR